jgi:hypothetical protein
MTRRQRRRSNPYVQLLAMFKKLYKRYQARIRQPVDRAPNAVSAELRALLERQITVEQYLGIKVDKALEPLQPILLEDELALVRSCVWQHVRSQPAWLQIISRLRKIRESTASGDGQTT